MAYKRYGEMNMRVLMKWFDSFCKDFNIPDKNELFSRIVMSERKYSKDEIDDDNGVEDIIHEALKNMSSEQKSYVSKKPEYTNVYVNRMFSEIKTEVTMPVLYAKDTVFERLWNSMEPFDYDFWSGFNSMVSLEFNATDLFLGEGMLRVRAESSDALKYVIFHFDACSEDTTVRKLNGADKDGFYQFGLVIYNKETKRFYVHHVGYNVHRNTLNLYISKDCTIKVEKFPSADIEYLFGLVLAHEKTETTVCANLKHLLLLQKAYKEYLEAKKDISEVKSKSGLTRRTKKHEARGEQVEVSVSDGVTSVIDKTVILSEYMKKTVSEKKEWQGGHHNSPVPHHRAGHWSRSKLGKVYWVEDTYVKSPSTRV